jgi:hypothetical protein
MAKTFVFLQIGDTSIAELLVKSIRKETHDARIIQCTNADSLKVNGVDEIFRSEAASDNLMTFRLKAFRDLGLESPAVYLDTDMIMLRPIDPSILLEEFDAVVCERSFDKNERFVQLIYRDFDFHCYKGKTMMEAHPYIACFTITRNYKFWDTAYEILMTMPSMFHAWFGDQEAIKCIVESGTLRIKKVPEATYACLPERAISLASKPRLLHFKGPERKSWMQESLAKQQK